jgi:hypothetical protein
MDWTVYPNSRIARLPVFLRPVGVLLRNLTPAGWRRYRYTYKSTDLGTSNYSPFLHDAAFNRIYDRVAGHWYEGDVDIRWKLWLLSHLALQRRSLPAGSPANFAEFGVYRGGCAFTVLSTANLPRSQRYFLFDTFEGTPDGRLSKQERRLGLSGEWTDTSVEAVTDLLAPWAGQVEIYPGDVFETLKTAETGELSFVHIDLNASAPTMAALEYAYPRMTPGAILVFDDYGSPRYDEQRLSIEEFFAGRPEDVLALPTGQAVVIKR